MRKRAILAIALVTALAASAVAFAAGQVNTYTVTAKVSPSKAGTKKKPVPVSFAFNYTVGEQTNLRPSPIKHYNITATGIRQSAKAAKKATCTAAKIIAAGPNNSVCSAAAVVGTGKIVNNTGATANTADKATVCKLVLTEYNGGKGHLVLYLHGGPSDPNPDAVCPIAVDQPINATVKGGTIGFDVPPGLLHPVTGLDNAVVQVTSSTKKGFFESIGKCKTTTVEFTDETNAKATAKTHC